MKYKTSAKNKRQIGQRNWNYIIGLVFILTVLSFVIIGIFWTPYDPNAMSAVLKNQPPSFSHLFGTDYMGRDILSRVMQGAKTTFFIGFITVLLGGGIGILVGATTGYFGGIMDEILMRINDGLTAFPSILLALVFVSILGTGKYNIIFALAIIFIPSFARIVRSEFIVQKELDYVKNAKLMGAGSFRIMFVHILPNTKRVLLSAFTIGFNNAVLAEAGMSYLSLGVQPPDASLGRMLAEAQTYIFKAPWFALAPGILIVLIVLGFGLINEEV